MFLINFANGDWQAIIKLTVLKFSGYSWKKIIAKEALLSSPWARRKEFRTSSPELSTNSPPPTPFSSRRKVQSSIDLVSLNKPLYRSGDGVFVRDLRKRLDCDTGHYKVIGYGSFHCVIWDQPNDVVYRYLQPKWVAAEVKTQKDYFRYGLLHYRLLKDFDVPVVPIKMPIKWIIENRVWAVSCIPRFSRKDSKSDLEQILGLVKGMADLWCKGHLIVPDYRFNNFRVNDDNKVVLVDFREIPIPGEIPELSDTQQLTNLQFDYFLEVVEELQAILGDIGFDQGTVNGIVQYWDDRLSEVDHPVIKLLRHSLSDVNRTPLAATVEL